MCLFQRHLEGAGDGRLVYISLYERSGLDGGSKVGVRRLDKCLYPSYHGYVRGENPSRTCSRVGRSTSSCVR